MTSIQSQIASSQSALDEPTPKKLKLNQEGQHYLLPIETIVKIYTHLDDFEEFKKCMGLCSEIRDYIFKSPKIMKKIRIQFSELSETIGDGDGKHMERLLDFIKAKGKYFLNMKIKLNERDWQFLIQILNDASNVEEFEYYARLPETDSPEIFPQNVPILTKLSSLRIPHKFLDLFIGKVKHLKRFSIVDPEGGSDRTKNITEFMNQQDNLEELVITTGWYGMEMYTVDLSPGFKFKLKKLSLYREPANFVEFIETQADHLEELKFFLNPDPIIFDTLLKFKKLTKLRIPMYWDDDFFFWDYSGWALDTVEQFDCVLDMKISTALTRFPNLKILECRMLEKDSGVFESIETLDCDYFSPSVLENVILPNLKTLIVKKPVDEFGWTEFAASTPNVEKKLLQGFKKTENVQ